ncbi:hypothetical protein Tco_0877101 [Tanacetum coccineum]|uniref:Gag-Pol polyprotein n=1 Tax=Tanacetum coccineum TaxID=301880 RepID=A0ABQ5BU65_9ASTR
MTARLNVMEACIMLNKLALTGAIMALHRITRHGIRPLIQIWSIQCIERVGYGVLRVSWSRDHVRYLPEYFISLSGIRDCTAGYEYGSSQTDADANDGNQFRQYVGQNVGNLNGYNAIQNVENQVVQNAVQNPSVQNVRNHNGLIIFLRIANQNVYPNGNGNIVAAQAEGNGNGNNGNQVRCYNYSEMGHLGRNCTIRPMRRDAAYLQIQLLIAQKEEAGIQLQAEEFDLMASAGDINEI